jgi:hypothetical protein
MSRNETFIFYGVNVAENSLLRRHRVEKINATKMALENLDSAFRAFRDDSQKLLLPPTLALEISIGSDQSVHDELVRGGWEFLMALPFLSRSLSRWPIVPSPFLASEPAVRSFSATAPASIVSKRKRAARLRKKKNLERQATLRAEEAAKKPSFALGHPKTDDSVWRSSALAKILIDKKAVWSGETTGLLNFGIPREASELLFEKLPAVSAQRGFLKQSDGAIAFEPRVMEEAEKAEEEEVTKADQLKRIVDLRNANSDGIAVENRRRVIETFARSERDTASPEVVGESGLVSLQRMLSSCSV